jgi:hypothetical protein
MGNYNPNFPTVLGNEFAPVAKSPVTIDTASAFGYTFRTQEQEDIATARVLMTVPPSGQPRRKVMTVEVYPDQYLPSTGPVRKIIVPVTSGANVASTSLNGGAASYQDALSNATNIKGVTFAGASAAMRAWFDVSTSNARLTSLLQNSRILDVSIRYAISGDFHLYNNPVAFSLERPSASNIFLMDEAITGVTSIALSVVPRRSRLGDYNPYFTTTIDPTTDPRRMPWKHLNGANNYIGLQAMSASGGTNIALRVSTSASLPGSAQFILYYCAMEITYAAEGRVAGGGYDLSGGVSMTDDLSYVDVPIFTLGSTGYPWSSSGGSDYAAMVGAGYVGATSQAFPMPVTVDRLVPVRDTFRGHRGVIIRKTLREGEQWTREDTDAVPAVAFYSSTTVFDATTIYPPSQVYVAPLVSGVGSLTFPGEAYAEIPDTSAGTYTHIRFYARRLPDTLDYLRLLLADNTDTPLGPQAQITVEEFELLPDIANGWREVTLPLSEPVVTTNATTDLRWLISSAADTDYPWQVLGADGNPYRETAGSTAGGTYGGSSAAAMVDGVLDVNADMSVMMIRDMPVPGGLAVTPAVQPLTVVDEYCGQPVQAIPTGIPYHQLSWDAVNSLAVAGFGHYEVQRRDTSMPDGQWETIGEITSVTATDMDDYEARAGVESSYRVRMVHEDGYVSEWGSTVTATIAAPGVTGVGVDASVLIFTSNHNPAGNLAYAQVWDSDGVPSQDFTYPEAGQTVLQDMYRRDYRTAFRPLERAGVEFTRTLLLNAAGVPPETLDRGALRLRDLAWDTVPYVCVRDELNNRWLAALAVPSSATRDVPGAGHLVLAPVTVAEVTATPAPVDVAGGCQGIRLEGAGTYQYWKATAPAVLYGTRFITDTFTRTTANGWGSATTTGQPWITSGGGVASDYAVASGVGTINSSTVTVDRRQFINDTLNYQRSRVEFVVPAVATGGQYSVGVLARYQDFQNHYLAKVNFATGGQFRLDWQKVVAGVATNLVSGANIDTYTAGTRMILEVMSRGTTLLARVWRSTDPVPSWDDFDDMVAVATDTALPITGRFGVQQTRAAANTNVNLTVQYDNVTVDTLPAVYDIRVQVRPYADQFDVSYGEDTYTNNTDSEGGWSVRLSYGGVSLNTYGQDSTTITSTKLTELGLVRNRVTWVRLLVTQDNGSGVMSVGFYTLADDGVTWTLVDTVTGGPPSQPFSPLAPGSFVQVENYQPGGIWTLKYELRVDGVLILSPDFAAQAIGTEEFTDAQGNEWAGPEGRGICATLE